MPIAPTIPNLAQLQAFRKTGRFDPTLRPQKIDMMKSARIVGVKVGGELIGVGFAEPATPEEIARLVKEDVSKSAELPANDANEVFNDSPLLPVWQPQVQPIGVLVQKSAEVETTTAPDVLEGIFPKWLQTS